MRFLLGGCRPSGRVADLVTNCGEEVGIVRVEPVLRILWMIVLGLIACLMVLELTGLAGLVEVAKRVRLNRKTPAHPVNQCLFGRSHMSSTSVEEIEGLWSKQLRRC